MLQCFSPLPNQDSLLFDPRHPQTLEIPRLRSNLENVSPEEQEEALMRLKHEQANFYYTAGYRTEVLTPYARASITTLGNATVLDQTGPHAIG